MPRLFVAIDLPNSVIESLTAIQPAACPGLRLVAPSRMHLTLHFLGDADVDTVSAALRNVVSPPAPLWIEGVGRFPGRTTTLWAGIRQTEELMDVHARLTSALSRGGFQLESRPYHPHVTLARCEPHVPERIVTQFLESHSGFSLPRFSADRFHLYSSDLSGGMPVYRLESTFELRM